MIYVAKDFNAVPTGLTNAAAEAKRQALLRERNQHAFSAACYGHDSVRQALESLYHRKCAYCEGQINDGFRLQVEHYRPKDKLKDDAQHSGYYWLAYEWSNLLLACQRCNVKKSNHFPLDSIGARVAHPHADKQQWRVDSASLRAEHPLLLNPELDERFEDHFDFRPDGTLAPLTPRAKTTADLCDLNRENLVLARYKLLERAVDDLLDQLDIFLEQQQRGKWVTAEQTEAALRLGFANLIVDLREAGRAHHAYSAFRSCLFANFETFVCRSIAQEVGEAASAIVRDAFQRFSNVPL